MAKSIAKVASKIGGELFNKFQLSRLVDRLKKLILKILK